MDSDSDGVIDASDEAFGQLKVWQDADGDAEVDEGEMRSLKEAGITGFDLDSYKANLGTITRLNDEGDEVEEQIERLKIGAAELHGVLNYTKSSTDEVPPHHRLVPAPLRRAKKRGGGVRERFFSSTNPP